MQDSQSEFAPDPIRPAPGIGIKTRGHLPPCSPGSAGFTIHIETRYKQKRGIVMKHLKLIAAALALLALSACVGFIVPIPVSGSTTTPDTERNARR